MPSLPVYLDRKCALLSSYFLKKWLLTESSLFLEAFDLLPWSFAFVMFGNRVMVTHAITFQQTPEEEEQMRHERCRSALMITPSPAANRLSESHPRFSHCFTSSSSSFILSIDSASLISPHTLSHFHCNQYSWHTGVYLIIFLKLLLVDE